ncbi:MAG: hypothetical protein ACREPU_06915 [Rhodanobacteraceae bacterium]
MKIIQKLIIIVAAIAINFAVLAWFHTWSTTAVANATPSARYPEKSLILPAVNVYPSAAQLRALRQTQARALREQASAGDRYACFVMPYYSFAARPSDCDEG